MSLKDVLTDKKIGANGKVSLDALVVAYLNTRTELAPFHARLERNSLKGFHPSGLSDACPRAIAYGLLKEKKLFKPSIITDELHDDNVPQHVKAQKEITFDTGHMLHMLYQYSYIPAIEKTAQVEVDITSLHEKYLISGTADIVMPLQDGKLYVVDLKTSKNELFSRLSCTEDVYSNHYYYIVQLNLYMLGLKIPRSIIYFINKNTGDRKEFVIPYDKSIVTPVLKTCLTAKKYLLGESDVPMLPECLQKKSKYKSCPFSSLCFRCRGKNKLIDFTTKEKSVDLIKS